MNKASINLYAYIYFLWEHKFSLFVGKNQRDYLSCLEISGLEFVHSMSFIIFVKFLTIIFPIASLAFSDFNWCMLKHLITSYSPCITSSVLLLSLLCLNLGEFCLAIFKFVEVFLQLHCVS